MELKDNYKPNHYHPINLDRWINCNDEYTCVNRSECMSCSRNESLKEPEPTIKELFEKIKKLDEVVSKLKQSILEGERVR